MFFNSKKKSRWQPDRDEFIAWLRTPVLFPFSIDSFPVGVDNTHIDIYISPQFTAIARSLVQRMLLYELGDNSWGRPSTPPPITDVRTFEAAYMGLMETGINRARNNSNYGQVQLLQLSVMKFLVQVVGDELEVYRSQLQHGRSDDWGDSGRELQFHERIVTLAKEEAALSYRITHKLFQQIYKLENTSLRKLRKSVMGSSWPVPKEMLFNPLLQISSIWSDEQMMRHYSLAILDRDDPRIFYSINRLVTEMFEEYLPDWMQPNAGSVEADGENRATDVLGAIRQRGDEGLLDSFLEVETLLRGSLQEVEYQQGLYSWLDRPDNFDLILQDSWVSQIGRKQQSRPPALTKGDGWDRFLDGICSSMQRADLMQKVLAAREVSALYTELRGVVPARLIYKYLSGGISRRKLTRKLSSMQTPSRPEELRRIMDAAITKIRRTPDRRERRILLHFLKDFALLRRDLKMAYQAYRIMDHLRILTQSAEVELSRSNGTLQEFVLHTEQQSEQRSIRNHVIIKADVRGSTAITAQLRERKLNPASHFSRNFFQPITGLLEDFGAQKVFVEGDAVILSIFEYEDTPHKWLCVAHACGVAQKILQVVDSQNMQNRKYGLPDLELGIGISFNDEAPAFLYDGDHQIMISPAINRADQLSSCSYSLRHSSLAAEIKRGVEVVIPLEHDVVQEQGADCTLRYNVNGIELDVMAFLKLKNELSMRRAGISVDGYSSQSAFYAGRYPDLNGTMRWLVVREAPICHWVDNSISSEEEWGRRFYEVITDSEVIAAIRQKFASRREQPEEVESDADADDSSPLLH